MSFPFGPRPPLPPDLFALTREQRIKAYYLTIAGPYPGPNRAMIAALVAHRLVEIEDTKEDTP